MSCTPRRRRPRATALACTTFALAATGLVGTSTAQAGTDSWSCALQNGQTCRYDRHSLTAVSAYSGNSGVSVAAGASYDGTASNMYYSWAQGKNYVCRVLSGNNVLYPIIRNVDGGYRTIAGGSAFGSSSGC